MLIGFLGLPNSGKTTIAAKLFAHLKENASTSELIVEQARFYIAKKRLESPNSPLLLDDKDQMAIAALQNKYETLMSKACSPDTYIVSDSSVINSSLYVSKDLWEKQYYKDALAIQAKKYDLLLYCHPFDLEEFPKDSNRVHTREDVVNLHKRASELLQLLKKSDINIKELLGSYPLEARCKESYLVVSEEYLKYIQGLPD